MPLYTYEDKDGNIVELLRSTENRDVEGLRRIMPDRFMFNGNISWKPRGSPMTCKQEVYDSCKRAEENGRLNEIKYSKRQMDRIWGDED